MKANLGNLDRALRFIAGTVLVALTLAGTIGPWGWLGVVLIATAFISFCPLYRLLSLSTRKPEQDH
ncbi:MAG: DUF2892 domain-containing protein [Lautropia sp.]|nr:DUF2892 domain-containing protein [Lautropia sp.]